MGSGIQDEKGMGMPTVISTFAGCGGSSLGYRWAGFRELLAIEWDRIVAETFSLNFPEVPVWQKDIRSISGHDVMDFCKMDRSDLDVLDGSPPCQGFSMAGKRDITDRRNDLAMEFVRLVGELRPKAFVMENVKGLCIGKMKGWFIEIMEAMKKLPYRVKCKLLNAKYYNVPQSRQRLIYLGVRNDLGREPSFPQANSRMISVEEALKNVRRNDDLDHNCMINWGLEHLKDLERLKEGQNLSAIYKKKFYKYILVDRHKPLPTVCKSLSYSGCTGYFIRENGKIRDMTVNEIKACCSFPQDFSFPALSTFRKTFENAINVIGNSVPPKMMEAIARNIRRNIIDAHRQNRQGND